MADASRRSFPCRPAAARRTQPALDQPPVSLSVGIPRPRAAGAGAADRRQAGLGGGAAGAEGNHRRARQAASRAGAAAGPDPHLRPAAFRQHHLRRPARRDLRQGDAARDAPHQHGGVQAPARAVAALSSGTADRRHHARHRARRPGAVEPGRLPAVPHHPHGAGNPHGRGHPVRQARLGVRSADADHPGGLHRLHRHHHRMAHPVRTPGQYARFGSLWPRHRQPAELRDGQVFRQREIRGRRATTAA